MTELTERAVSNTVQSIPDAKKGETGTALSYDMVFSRSGILSAWGTRGREQELRRLDRNNWLWAWQGAASGFGNRVASTPFEVNAGRNVARYFQAVLREAHFGAGWTHFTKVLTRDFLRHDIGAFVEVVAPGDPLREPTGPIVGLAHLDAMRCYPTRDPEYPVVYWNREGTKHLLHRTRVLRIYDNPDGDDNAPNVGMCALSRASAILDRWMHMDRYVGTELDDKPTPGIVTYAGLSPTQFDKVMAAYRLKLQADALDEWGRTLNLPAADANNPIKVEMHTFSRAPAKFDWKEYTELQINALALALGVDKLDLWEITSSGLGSGAQAEVMAQKSKGRTYGAFIAELERALNTLLPDSVEFKFAPKDADEDKDAATIAQTWVSVAQSVGTAMTDDEKRVMLANQVPAIRDAIADENGQVQRLNDVSDAVPTDVPRITIDDTENVGTNAALTQAEPTETRAVRKGYATTSAKFIDEMRSNIETAALGTLPQSNVANRIVRTLYRYGQQAYKDGLEQGGVKVDTLDSEDLARVQTWLSDQTGYVDSMVASVYGKARNLDPPPDFTPKAALWANKSLREVYSSGLRAADANGLYLWVLGDTDMHCPDCLRLSGQAHRMKDWEKRGWLPGNSKLSCKGFNCRCKLVKTTGQARGRY